MSIVTGIDAQFASSPKLPWTINGCCTDIILFWAWEVVFGIAEYFLFCFLLLISYQKCHFDVTMTVNLFVIIWWEWSNLFHFHSTYLSLLATISIVFLVWWVHCCGKRLHKLPLDNTRWHSLHSFVLPRYEDGKSFDGSFSLASGPTKHVPC